MINKILSYIFDKEDSYDKNVLKMLNIRYFLIFVCNMYTVIGILMYIFFIFGIEEDTAIYKAISFTVMLYIFIIPTFLLTILKKIENKPMLMQWVAFIFAGPLLFLGSSFRVTFDLPEILRILVPIGGVPYLYIFISSLISNIHLEIQIKKRINAKDNTSTRFKFK